MKRTRVVAIQMGDKPEKRIVFSDKLEVFYLQEKHLFIWREVGYTLEPKTARVWKNTYNMTWTDKRWAN